MRFTTDSSPLRATLTAPITALMISAMLIAPAAPAFADDDTIPDQDAKKIKRQILESLDDPELGDEASVYTEEPWFSGFRISKKGPIQYRQTLQIGDDEVSFKVYGPVIKKKPGLRFKVEGLHVGDNPVRVEGFGNTKEGGIRFTIRF